MSAALVPLRPVRAPLPTGPAVTAGEVLALAGRRLRHLRRAPGRLVGVVMNPLVTMLAMGYLFKNAIVAPGHGPYVEYLIAGAAAQVGLAGVGPTAIAVAMDLRGGLVDRFRSLPISRGAVLLGHTLADLVMSVAGLVVVLAVGLALGWRVHTGVGSFLAGFAILVGFCYVMLWVGVLVGMVWRNAETIDAVGSLVVVLFSFLSGAFVAVSQYPQLLRPIAEWNPVTSVTNQVRLLWGNTVAQDAGTQLAHPGVVVLVSMCVVLVVSAVLSLRRYQRAAV